MSKFESETIRFSLFGRGLNTVEAVKWAQLEYPNIEHWMVWELNDNPTARCICSMAKSIENEGRIGIWKWKRQESVYGSYLYSGDLSSDHDHHNTSTGFFRIEYPGGYFILFLYLDSIGMRNNYAVVSCLDEALLKRFTDAVERHIYPDVKIHIRTNYSPDDDQFIDPLDEEGVIMDENIRKDIYDQTDSFFNNESLYKSLGLPVRRGFLFIGPPGTGKTLTIRNLIRKIFREQNATFWIVRSHHHLDDNDVQHLFKLAQERSPAVIIMEDVDSLTTETRVTRSGFLNLLDGINPTCQTLILASSNYPEKIDPALAHRPSRFDRVWLFTLPDKELRLRYLEWAFAGFHEEMLDHIAGKTNNWSFAYLNELRVTTMITALNAGRKEPDEKDLLSAHDLLDAQFISGTQNHTETGAAATVGFNDL